MVTSDAIVSGLVSGLLTSFVVFVLGWMLKAVVHPWISNKIYQGIRVDGVWVLENKEANTSRSLYSQRETLEIEQVAGKLTGRLVLDPLEGENMPLRMLKVEGVVRDGFVTLGCTSTTRRSLGFVQYLGRIAGDGARIEGCCVYYDIGAKDIRSVRAAYTRQPTS